MNGDRRRNVRLQARKRRFDAVHRLDDVGAGLLEDDQKDGLAGGQSLVLVGLAWENPGAHLVVLDVLDGVAEVLDPDGRAVVVADDHSLPFGSGEDLIVRIDGLARLAAVERPLGRIDRVVHDLGADGVHLQVQRGRLARIDPDAHRRFLLAADGHQAHAGNARDLLGQDVVGVVAHRVDRQGVGGEREDHDWRVGWIDLSKARRAGQVGGELRAGGVDRRLDVLTRRVDVTRQIELQGDGGRAVGTGGGHLGDPGDERELTLERRGHVGRHGFRTGAGQGGADLNGREVHLGQGRNGKVEIGHEARQQERRGDQ